jgi:hypothetical protein
MGYDVHITRAESWAENEDAAITLEEWECCVERDPELMPDPDNGMPMAVWTAHPDGDEARPWLSWDNGNITTKNPDEALLEKMLSIAESLDAKVQGDDGEEYPLTGAPESERRIGRTLLIAVATGVFAAIALPLGLYLDIYINANCASRTDAPGGLVLASALLALCGVLCVAFGAIATLIAAIAKQKPFYLCVFAALCHLFAISYLIIIS